MRALLAGVVVGLTVAACVVAGYLLISNFVGAPPAPAQTARPAQLTLRVSEGLVQQQVEMAQSSNDDYTEPQVDLRAPNLIDLTFTTRLTGLGQVRPTVTLQLAAHEGRLAVTTQSVVIGSVPLPTALAQQQFQPVADALETQLNAGLTQQLQPWSLHLTGVSVAPDELIIRAGAT